MEALSHYEKEVRPWGNFERFVLNEKATVKILTMTPGESLSLQMHAHRDEFWRILKGSGVVRIGDTEKNVGEGDTVMITQQTVHRATAGPDGLQFLEIAFGDFDEHDEARLEDTYGRV